MSFLLDDQAGWRADGALSQGVRWADGPLTLAPRPGFPQPLTDASGTFGGLHEPLGVAAGAGGDVVILDRAGTRVLRFDACAGRFVPFACLGPRSHALVGARGVAVTDRGDLAATDPAARRLLLVTGDGMGVRRVVGPVSGAMVAVAPVWSVPPGGTGLEPAWPAGTWEPWGVAAGRGRLVVTDRASGLVHLFDDLGNWCRGADGAGGGLGPLTRPTAVALDRDGRIYVLQEGVRTVRVLDPDGVGVADVDTLDDARSRFCPVAVAIGPRGELCVATDRGGLCVSGSRTGLDASVTGLAFDADGNAVVLDGQRGCVVRLRDAGGYPVQGRFVSQPLDSGRPGLAWHRVVLRGLVPAGTSVRVDTLTADAVFEPGDLAALPQSRWVVGPQLSGLDGDARDVLVRSAPGRYLWLAVTLVGDGASTPRLDDIEVELPRRSSRRFLPAVFQAEPTSADFLDRFLALFDTVRASTTAPLNEIQRYVDPMAVPDRPDFLSWLAQWVGMATDAGLPVARRRRLVQQATALYARRGTPDGVARFVSLFAGAPARVLEQYRLRRWAIAGRARLGDDSTLFGPAIVKRLQLDVFAAIGEFQLAQSGDALGVHAHRFTVFVIPPADATDDELAQVERLARLATEAAKPAHTEADLVVVAPRLRVGRQATVGLDAVVGGVPAPAQLGARLGDGLVLGGAPVPARAAVVGHSRIGRDETVTGW